MHIFQLLEFSTANIGNLESDIPLHVKHRQVIPQGLLHSHVMKLNWVNMFAQFENLHYTLCEKQNGGEKKIYEA